MFLDAKCNISKWHGAASWAKCSDQPRRTDVKPALCADQIHETLASIYSRYSWVHVAEEVDNVVLDPHS